MRLFFLQLVFAIFGAASFAQNNELENFIFIPHARSENKVQQSVLPAIEKIDFSKYSMILLGGDLTYYTSVNRTSLNYCNNLFHLDSPNTLWTLGNHDVDNLSLIHEYTGRPTYYAAYRNGITFMVLNTEQNANGFISSYINGDQLQMVKSVCDTISASRYLVLIHHRLLWMIGNDDFKTRLDSVGESTRQLDTTNFYQDLFPQLQKVKAKGIQVICLGGDKSKINIQYSPEDSIRFFAATMAPEYPDSVNNVLIFNFTGDPKELQWDFVHLDKLEKVIPDTGSGIPVQKSGMNLIIEQYDSKAEIGIMLQAGTSEKVSFQVYDLNGRTVFSSSGFTNELLRFCTRKKGMFLIRVCTKSMEYTKKIMIRE
jgi:hypothetical protein